MLIGDPKQAIYAFRGADVFAYLEAPRGGRAEWTLDVNWRSDQGLLEAYDALFADAQLGHAGIAYRNVARRDANRSPRLVGARSTRRCGSGWCTPTTAWSRSTADEGRSPGRPTPGASSPRDLAADVVAAAVVGAPEVIARRRDGAEAARTTLHPGHIAVLVRTNSQAAIVRDALQAAGVPAVIGGAGSVFATEPAREWLRLLEALERPTARDRAGARRADLLRRLDAPSRWRPPDEDEWEDLHWSLHRWAALLRDQGVASLFETVSSRTRRARRGSSPVRPASAS